ncbi:M14 family metallopeptidase [Simiduia agarivorans]|uniref:Zinc carboxypeptidase-like protein n=1 Tax=Simiduia agarivorans (strain DSM 21679 / JCM 13881 / BCRC 17597 / SA1) TaxID=1117647 RepID=K4KQ18_SIMAS|nr:M14 family metallocarboxypeptidase [Simiduia agarivorans]AFV00194.1 zinc carboxypeptidase-like protein [Simiduia agarivorans SA1 = DSM 21679]
MTAYADSPYPIGTPGTPWNETEKHQWLCRQQKHRLYSEQVLPRIQALGDRFDIEQYGELDYQQLPAGTPAALSGHYPLLAVKSRSPSHLPLVLVTGGVHGYETSGVMGALMFLEQEARNYSDSFQLIAVPCVSPWGFETINRWNPHAIDPNRSFGDQGQAAEAQLLKAYIHALGVAPVAHIDLHETTDTDNTEFRVALAARDGVTNKVWNIPDGFYLVDCADRPQPAFQRAILDAVEKVTHIAEADPDGKLIGTPIEQFGVINYATKKLGLCAGMTDAHYTTTTEVYPDSPSATPEQCARAQVAAIAGGLNYLRTAAR